ncbi:LysR family transcriptional regulator [Mangrovicoccus algicola]|uniref:LysR family transcriptional regulator n=1 Tax=Mangrovicoccus algicola TaxID=2771008 RepID=A0A8J6Z8P3_9RHOB|nr:LysR family transcriptional regulator [Mangrovicoccus algicola]MBE3639969.1 LysR family transcriptional regulator [Mangrovicoccus algicola]
MRDLAGYLKFRHFLLIQALAEQGTMHAAARALNMTQSTMSKMLADLEAELDAPLFRREPRGMAPTELGEFAIEFAASMLAHLGRFSEEFRDRRLGGAGTLVIGAIMGAAPDLVARAVADLKQLYPLLTVRMMGETSDHILEMLERGDVDIAVGRFSETRYRSIFDFEPLALEPLALVARRGHWLAGRPVAGGLGALAGLPWVLQPATNPTRAVLEAAFHEAGLPMPRNQVESVSIFAILHLLQSSEAVALLSQSVVDDHLKGGLLERLDVEGLPAIPGFGILTRRAEPPGPRVDHFRALLRRRNEERRPPGSA